jgi:hypothetical protein
VDDVTLTCVLGALEREINRRVKQKKKKREGTKKYKQERKTTVRVCHQARLGRK